MGAQTKSLLAGALLKKLYAVVFLLSPMSNLVLYHIPSVKARDNEAEIHAAKGVASAKAGDLQLAETELRQAVVLAPENVGFLDDLATILAMQKKFDESTSYFERALKIDSSDLVARRYLAANLWQLHRYAEARQNIRILLSASPEDPQGLLLLGMVSENTKDYATAVKSLSAVPALVRVQPESIAALVHSYYHIGQTQKARAWLKELQNHPAGIRAALLGAQIADEMHDYKTAEELLSVLAPSYPDHTELRYQLALVKFHAQNFDESRHILQQLLDDGHATKEVDRLLASCLEAQNRPEEAIHALQNLIQLDPGDETSYVDLANMLVAGKRVSEATEFAKRMIKTFPDSSRVLISKGSIELRAGNFTDAVSSFSRAAQLDPANAEAAIGLARAQANAGMRQQAKATLESAIQRFPKKAPFELELGRVLLKEAETGDRYAQVRAEGLFHSAIAHDNKLAEAHYELGELALSNDDLGKAIAHLETAATLDSSSAKTHFALSRAYRRSGREREAAKEMALFEKLKE